MYSKALSFKNLGMLFCGGVALTPISPSFASTPESWAKLDAASQAACIKASGLTNATAGPPTRYSDKLLIDARTIDGIWPQPHMKGAKARLLCLYHRKKKRV